MVDVTNSGEKRIFLRKASGLIRTASLLDTFIFNLGLISVGIGVGTMLLYGPAFYPGASLLWATIGGAVVMTVCTLGFVYWAVTIPRSGGDYVFNSRIWPPFVAVTASFTNIVAQIFFGAVATYWIILIGISPMFSTLGEMTGSAWWIDASTVILEPWPLFLIGCGILTLSHLILYSGMRTYLWSQKIVFAVAILGLIVLIVVQFAGSTDSFKANLNTLFAASLGVPDVYQAIIDSAKENGWGYEGSADFFTTMKLANWVVLPYIGAWLSIFIGGEIKAAARAQTVGMLGAAAGALLLWVLTLIGAQAAFGYDFIGAATYNFLGLYVWGFIEQGVAAPINPMVTSFAGIMTDSIAITWIVSLGFIAWIWMWIPGVQTCAVRAMVAWALDRVAPSSFAYISPTRHTPAGALLVSYIFSIVFMACLAFTAYASTIIIIGVALTLGWALTLAGGIAFPFRRKEIYEKSPISRQKILGLPAMSVICFFATAGMLWAVVALLLDPIAAGHDPVQLAIAGSVILAGLIFYFVMKAIRRAQGVDVTQAFKQIPVE